MSTRAENPDPPSRLAAAGATIGYDAAIVCTDLDLAIPHESFTAIIGPNGCGKSTVLRALARVLTPRRGQVLLDGRAITRYRAKEVARELGLLPQTSIAPDGIRVLDLVSRGRAPHQSLIQQWRPADEGAVTQALAATRLTELADRLVDELSGGQRQRVWIAMALAQQTDLLLLDEPTTFLDVAHQIEVLDLLTDLNRSRGITLVLVLHDLNLAARYADHLVMIAGGGISAAGTPAEVLTAQRVQEVFGLASTVMTDPVSGTPLMLPIGRHHAPPT